MAPVVAGSSPVPHPTRRIIMGNPKKLKVKRRELYDDDYPDGYMESDNSFVLNNCELCVKLLEDLEKKEDQGNFYYYYDV